MTAAAQPPVEPQRSVFDVARDHHISAKRAREVKAATDRVIAEKERRRRDV